MYRLLRSGYKAYLVGGGVRDLLLGKIPKDFDIGTDAPPEAVRSLFRNSRIIGRRFRINHVYFPGNKIIEVATFRALNDEVDIEQPGMPIANDNTYGDPESDALRRDLTINGLFYDLSGFTIIDYVGGIEDLRNGIIRIIGDPEKRIREDPVRMIRAVRHAARTGFLIEAETYEAICGCGSLIALSSKARVHEEFVRELRGGYSLDSFRLLRSTGLLPLLLPVLAHALEVNPEERWSKLESALARIDEVVRSGAEISVAAAFAAITVGIVSRDTVPRDELLTEWEEGIRFWEEAPAALPPDDESRIALEKEITRRQSREATDEPRQFRRRRREQPTSSLARVINAFFLPVGVSRKERELMEQLLKVRYALLVGIDPAGIMRALRHTPQVLSEMRFLLSLSGPAGVEVAAMLNTDKSENTPSASDESAVKRRPRRRRRSGRRRPRRPTIEE